MTEIPALVTAAWTALQPFLPVVGAKAAEEIGKTAIGKLWAAIEGKFAARPAAKEALHDLLKDPQDADVQGAFRAQLKKLLEEDRAFADSLAELLEVGGHRFNAQAVGDGVVAQGEGAVAVENSRVRIGGNASGNVIIAGDTNTVNSERKKRK